jgi:hypothetical protein
MYWAQVVEQATDMKGIQWQCAPAITHFTPDGTKIENSISNNRLNEFL